MAPKNKASPKGKAAAKALKVSKKLKEQRQEALQKEQKQIVQSQEARLNTMRIELSEWFESHPFAFEYIHRGCFLGTFDNLDNPDNSASESGSQKLPSYQNKFRLLAKARSVKN